MAITNWKSLRRPASAAPANAWRTWWLRIHYPLVCSTPLMSHALLVPAVAECRWPWPQTLRARWQLDPLLLWWGECFTVWFCFHSQLSVHEWLYQWVNIPDQWVCFAAKDTGQLRLDNTNCIMIKTFSVCKIYFLIIIEKKITYLTTRLTGLAWGLLDLISI